MINKINKNVTIVMDGQAGSCGKGKIAGYLARKDNVTLAINNWASNAGHTFVDDYDNKMISQHIPTSIINKDTILVIGPGAIITPEILINEILNNLDKLGNRKLFIHPRAMIIKEKHRSFEREHIRSGSTFKGCGAAQAEKITRMPGVELMGNHYNELPEQIKSKIELIDTGELVNEIQKRKSNNILIEGSQGFDLDINYGLDYPYVTSRQCSAGQLIADAGISPFCVKDIIMVIRPYPIRISNETELGNEIYSGSYGDSKELNWEELKARCSAPSSIDIKEYTTVTKRVRRIFEMNWQRLKYSIELNKPNQIAINFVQYIDWNAYRCNDYKRLPIKVKKFIKKVEEISGVPVTLIGTGERDCDIIDLRFNK